MVTRSELARAERKLRQYDKALRVRISEEASNVVLVERKTYRGRIGALPPQREVRWSPDGGRRREEGHVLVCQIPRSDFSVRALRESLIEADTWKKAGWIDEVERRDKMRHTQTKHSRQQNIRYKAAEVWDRYAWRSKSRVSMFG